VYSWRTLVSVQPVETVIAVLAATRDGASINAAAKVARVNYRTAQRILNAADDYRQRQLVVAS
jgi:molybdenum-dependent DNA-binding transcriptional regulator ModE